MQSTNAPRPGASTVATVGLIGIVIGFLLGGLSYKKFDKPCMELPVIAITSDTVTVRDTLRLEVPAAVDSSPVRRDTVWLQISPAGSSGLLDGVEVPPKLLEADTVPRLQPDGALVIPISKREYMTKDYRAVVEGWRPRLISLEVYPETRIITNNITKLKKPRYAIVAGLGLGYDGEHVRPEIGFKVGRVLWSGK
jgi:hypothetical protein